MKKVCVVILNWNGGSLTLGCLEALQKSDYASLEYIVVDNGSTDGSLEQIINVYPTVTVIKNAANVGFAAGCNQGIAAGLKQGADYLLMLNNDTWVNSRMISTLVRVAMDHQDRAATLPKIYVDKHLSRLWFVAGEVNYWMGLFSNPAYNSFDDGRFDSITDAAYASGCCILMPKGVVERVGGFDSNFFAYVEDVDWSIRCRREGFRLIVCPDAKLWHGVSATGKKNSSMMRYLLTRNHLWTMRRHANAAQFTTSMLFLPLRSMWRMAQIARVRDWESIGAELRGLKDGLLGSVMPQSSVGRYSRPGGCDNSTTK